MIFLGSKNEGGSNRGTLMENGEESCAGIFVWWTGPKPQLELSGVKCRNITGRLSHCYSPRAADIEKARVIIYSPMGLALSL